ncbi:hypothetical protein DRE_07463 [Drechslerella stenobrocha 248]|uniref:Uncharacterized protein n=1 Tax=Drechslerella stenobrocha 248 TaxID=1043628 RepID=W7HIJ9_9PEZI|nr:hypothetical protein DRE_07463 [Drechslerella stenobrocha 248]
MTTTVNPLAPTSVTSTPSSSRSPSPSSSSLQKPRTQPPFDSFAPTASSSSAMSSAPAHFLRAHGRSKSVSSASPSPSMIRSQTLPLPNRGFPTKNQGPPPSPKWMTTPASPTYRNSFVPTFPSTVVNLPSIAKRPSFLRTSTPPPAAPPRIPPAYLASEVFPGANSQLPSYPPSLTSNASSPTSSRSCSPSLTTYSLETIEDSPDGELLAILEEEEERQQREQAEKEEKEKDKDTIGLGLSLVTSSMNSMSLRENKRRQRWSVCGAERRSDFDLETIYED